MDYPAPPENPTEPMISARGFWHLPSILGSYGGKVRVYESSAAFHPHLWIQITEPDDLNQHGRCMATDSECLCAFHEATSHLSIENAIALRDQLTTMIERLGE